MQPQDNPARVLLGLHGDSTEWFLLKNPYCLECITNIGTTPGPTPFNPVQDYYPHCGTVADIVVIPGYRPTTTIFRSRWTKTASFCTFTYILSFYFTNSLHVLG